MSARAQTTVRADRRSRQKMLEDRLRLIKKRHKELILKPREEFLGGLFDEDDDAFHSLDECEELQMLEALELEAEA